MRLEHEPFTPRELAYKRRDAEAHPNRHTSRDTLRWLATIDKLGQEVGDLNATVLDLRAQLEEVTS